MDEMQHYMTNDSLSRVMCQMKCVYAISDTDLRLL